MQRSRHVHWPRRKIKGSSGRQKPIKHVWERKLNEMKIQKGTHRSNMTRNVGINLRRVMPKILYEQDCQQIHDLLFFPPVSTTESNLSSAFLSFAFHGLAFVLAKLLWPRKQSLLLLLSTSSLNGVITADLLFLAIFFFNFKTRERDSAREYVQRIQYYPMNLVVLQLIRERHFSLIALVIYLYFLLLGLGVCRKWK